MNVAAQANASNVSSVDLEEVRETILSLAVHFGEFEIDDGDVLGSLNDCIETADVEGCIKVLRSELGDQLFNLFPDWLLRHFGDRVDEARTSGDLLRLIRYHYGEGLPIFPPADDLDYMTQATSLFDTLKVLRSEVDGSQKIPILDALATLQTEVGNGNCGTEQQLAEECLVELESILMNLVHQFKNNN